MFFFSSAEKKYRENFVVETTSSKTFVQHYTKEISETFQINAIKFCGNMDFLRFFIETG